MKRIALVVLSLGVLATAAAAAPPKPAPAPQRVKNVAIEAEDVKGEIVLPSVEQLSGRKPAARDGLIRPRADFVREIVRSAEDL
jgi:hypothetical protein